MIGTAQPTTRHTEMNAANKRMHKKIQPGCDRFTGYKQMCLCAVLALHIISHADEMIRINRSVCRCANFILS